MGAEFPSGDPIIDNQQSVREILVPLDSMLGDMGQALDDITFYRLFCEGKVTALQLAMVFGQFYPYIAQTPRTLRTAAETTRVQYAQHRDPFYVGLWQQFKRHEESETGHENLLVNDLAVLGYSTSAEVLIERAWEPVREYIRAAQQTAETHPIANIGEAWLLEGITPSVEGQWPHIVENSGIPNIEHAVSFMQKEAEADVEHLDNRREFIRQLEVTSEAQEHWEQIKARAEQVKAFYLSLWQQFDQSA